MPRSSAAFALVVAALFAGCQPVENAGSGVFPESRTIPLLQPSASHAPERDDPPRLVAKLIREQRQGLALLRRAGSSPADAAGGCVHARATLPGPQPKEWLPQPPKIRARVLGRQVEIDVELKGNPTSLACRPAGFAVAISSSASTVGGVDHFQLFGPGARTAPRRFRVLGHIPINGYPPYRLSTSVATALGLRSPYVEQTLKCPEDQCLRGPTVQAHAITIPSPILPLRGMTTGALERSLRSTFAFGNGDKTVGPAMCGATTCSVAFSDRLLGASGTARYRIQGEQVAGCWLGTLTDVERKPADGEVSMPETIGGCVGWR